MRTRPEPQCGFGRWYPCRNSHAEHENCMPVNVLSYLKICPLNQKNAFVRQNKGLWQKQTKPCPAQTALIIDSNETNLVPIFVKTRNGSHKVEP